MRDALKICCVVAPLFGHAAVAQDTAREAAQAADMKSPVVSSAAADWAAARRAIAASDVAADTDPLTRLNRATAKLFPNIAASPVPVLLPFDTGAFLRDQTEAAPGDASKYLSGFRAALFYSGPSGYDAAFALQPQELAGLDLTYARRVDIQISGSALVYDLDGPSPAAGSAVPELESQFPGIRSALVESHLRYTFVRFGVPYAVSIECFDGPARMRRLSCREASKVAVRFLKALNIAGGAPPDKPAAAPRTIERPERTSSDFTYYAAGDILPSTGVHGQGGRADATVYSRIRFPIAQAPAYVNSQAFMNWGNCDFTGRVALGGDGKNASYRCRVNGVPLFHDQTKNYAYPWRDNFCEHRSFYVTQCPAGMGHQGEDIRAGPCKLRDQSADHCEPSPHNIVAVRDGMVLRNSGDEALYLVVNGPGEHVRFRYLHMNPKMLDAAGMVSGRMVAEGDVLGPVGDYGAREGSTTYHLHFDVQVPTEQGWVFVNPYTTLVASYERLIGGRGRVVRNDMLAGTANGASAGAARSPESQTPTSPEEAIAAPGPRLATSPPKRAQPSSPAPSDAIVLPESRPRMQPSAEDDRKAKSKAESTAKAERETERGAAHKDARKSADDESRSERKKHERKAKGAAHCKAHLAKGHRRRDCDDDAAEERGREKHAHVVRAVDRRVSHQSDRTRHRAGDVHARHARSTSRHGGA